MRIAIVTWTYYALTTKIPDRTAHGRSLNPWDRRPLALRASALRLAEDLAPGARTTDSRSGITLRGALVSGQVAVSLVLLIGAGLLIRSFTRLAATNPGFDVQHLLTGEIQLVQAQYPDQNRRIQFFDGLGRI